MFSNGINDRGRTLFWDPTGPLIRYSPDSDTLRVDDLNPETHISFQILPYELFVIGLKCIWAALRP